MLAIILEMLEQRGYEDIREEKGEITGVRSDERSGDDRKIIVFTDVIQKLNKEEINTVISKLQKRGLTHGIIIYDGAPTPAIKDVIKEVANLGIVIEMFHREDLAYNCTKNIYVPEHLLLSKEEAKAVKDAVGGGAKLPIMLHTDAISRFYGYRKGDMVKVIRKGGIVSYRLVR